MLYARQFQYKITFPINDFPQGQLEINRENKKTNV